MRIRRSKPVDNFTIIPNATLRDERLSYCARGVLAELLSRPSGWEASADALSERARRHRGESVGEGRRALRAAFKELEAAGYMVRHREQGERGRFVTVLEVFDAPQDRDTGGRRTADGTSVRVTSVDATSVGGTSSIRTGVGSTKEEDLIEEDATSSSADVPEPADEPEAITGGGGGSDLRSLAIHIAEHLDYLGKPPKAKQRQAIEDGLVTFLEAGWTVEDLAIHLDLTGQLVRYAPALYMTRLDPVELKGQRPSLSLPALPSSGGVRGRVASAEEINAMTLDSLFGRTPSGGPAGGTDGRVGEWMDLRDRLAAQEARKGAHRPYSNEDSWSAPADPVEAAKIPWCGDPECDPVTRTRDGRDENGLPFIYQCETCHPKQQPWQNAS